MNVHHFEMFGMAMDLNVPTSNCTCEPCDVSRFRCENTTSNCTSCNDDAYLKVHFVNKRV